MGKLHYSGDEISSKRAICSEPVGTQISEAASTSSSKPRYELNSSVADTYSSNSESLPLEKMEVNSPNDNSNSSRAFRKRLSEFRNAAAFAFDMGQPLRLAVTISWAACLPEATVEGHVLALLDEDRCKVVRRRLTRLARELGFPFVAVWARAVGPRMGEHLHLFLAWGRDAEEALVRALERLTGVELDPVPPRYPQVAKSEGGGWLLTVNYRGRLGALDYAEYLARQDQKHRHLLQPLGKCFGVSQAIGRTAQRRSEWKLAA